MSCLICKTDVLNIFSIQFCQAHILENIFEGELNIEEFTNEIDDYIFHLELLINEYDKEIYIKHKMEETNQYFEVLFDSLDLDQEININIQESDFEYTFYSFFYNDLFLFHIDSTKEFKHQDSKFSYFRNQHNELIYRFKTENYTYFIYKCFIICIPSIQYILHDLWKHFSENPENPEDKLEWSILKKTFHKKSLKVHPDKNKDIDPNVFKEMNEAYQKLNEYKDASTNEEKFSWLMNILNQSGKENLKIKGYKINNFNEDVFLEYVTFFKENLNFLGPLKTGLDQSKKKEYEHKIRKILTEKKKVQDLYHGGIVYYYSPLKKKRKNIRTYKFFYFLFFAPYFMKQNIKECLHKIPEEILTFIQEFLQEEDFNEVDELLFGQMNILQKNKNIVKKMLKKC